ncbi:MAG TPA: MarR family winged helix-turn-helix transcriptional regulator [Candidatus Hydrogenedentes bacterium]|nr:MarR family winged helix-turn-helix transcriptional regulator [Candidatus Hydrogenedentota bacterium]HOK90414.1 MarR family winged helix-turn-helix transcriptional regulator [Candidatus Hydrogenedentota bacterium]
MKQETADEIILLVEFLHRAFGERMARAMHQQARFTCELTFPQMRALHAVVRLGTPTLQQLAAELGISSPSACVMVDKLESMGLVVRGSTAADRRIVTITPTPLAREIISFHRQKLVTSLREVMDALGEDATLQWLETLRRVSRAVSTQTGMSLPELGPPGDARRKD